MKTGGMGWREFVFKEAFRDTAGEYPAEVPDLREAQRTGRAILRDGCRCPRLVLRCEHFDGRVVQLQRHFDTESVLLVHGPAEPGPDGWACSEFVFSEEGGRLTIVPSASRTIDRGGAPPGGYLLAECYLTTQRDRADAEFERRAELLRAG